MHALMHWACVVKYGIQMEPTLIVTWQFFHKRYFDLYEHVGNKRSRVLMVGIIDFRFL